MKKKSVFLVFLILVTIAMVPVGCEREPNTTTDTIVTQAKIEGQWLYVAQDTIKVLYDISYEKEGYVIVAMQNKGVANKFNLPEDTYLYHSNTLMHRIKIIKKDETSGTIVQPDYGDALFVHYSELTPSSVVLQNERETMRCKAAPERIKIVDVATLQN